MANVLCFHVTYVYLFIRGMHILIIAGMQIVVIDCGIPLLVVYRIFCHRLSWFRMTLLVIRSFVACSYWYTLVIRSYVACSYWYVLIIRSFVACSYWYLLVIRSFVACSYWYHCTSQSKTWWEWYRRSTVAIRRRCNHSCYTYMAVYNRANASDW